MGTRLFKRSTVGVLLTERGLSSFGIALRSCGNRKMEMDVVGKKRGDDAHAGDRGDSALTTHLIAAGS